MQQLQAVLQAGRTHAFQQDKHAGRGKTELGAITAGVLPVAGRGGGQAHPQAETRPQLSSLLPPDDQFQLGEFLDDESDAVSEPLGHAAPGECIPRPCSRCR